MKAPGLDSCLGIAIDISLNQNHKMTKYETT